MRIILVLVVLYSSFLLSPSTRCVKADNWPQWQGPNRDGIWHEEGIIKSIPADGPPVLWRVPLAGGYSGPAVVGERLYVADYMKRDGDLDNNPNNRSLLSGKERVLCFDTTTGKEIWTYEYDCPYSISYAAGPRCTPTVSGGRVYALGSEGNFLCLDASDGHLLWQKDFKEEYSAKTPIWGFCGHPLVFDDLVICVVGGEGSVAVAFDRASGTERWRALTASEQGYCPPTLIQSAGVEQLLIWDADNLNSLEPATGRSLWSEPLKPMYGMSIMVPQLGRLHGEQVLFASGIGKVGALYALKKNSPAAEVVWRGGPKNAMYCGNSTPFIEDNTIYGCDCHSGMLTAVDLESGDRLWETNEPTSRTDRPAKHGTAFLIRQPTPNDPFRVWLFSETGDLILARLTRDAYEELGRTHLLEPTNECFGRPVVWSHPAFANGCCFVRNDEELICVSLLAKDTDD